MARDADELINTRVRVLRALHEDPRASYRKLEKIVGANETTIRRALAALRQERFIESVRRGRGAEHTVDLSRKVAPDIDVTVGELLRVLGTPRTSS